MAVAVLIWASWLVLTSEGRTTALSVVDLAVFRALIPALVLVPLLWRHRQYVARLGLARCLALSAYGAPFTLCVGLGLNHAPVAHAGALVPGFMPVVALALGAVVFSQKLSTRQGGAVLLILCGAVMTILLGGELSGHPELWRGHALFLTGALCWACFAATLQRTAVSPFLATAIVGAISSVVLVPVWFLFDLSNLGAAPMSDVAFQMVFQGLLSGLLALYAFGRALVLIPDMAGMLSALTPGVATGLAIIVLGQLPDTSDVLALVLVVAGLALLASGSPAQLKGSGTVDQAPEPTPPPTSPNRKVTR